jgi:hypothetical protein
MAGVQPVVMGSSPPEREARAKIVVFEIAVAVLALGALIVFGIPWVEFGSGSASHRGRDRDA